MENRTANLGKKKQQPADSTMFMYGKIPPQNVEAEKALLGQLIYGSSRFAEVREILPDGDRFYRDPHQRIYSAICRLYDNGSQVDSVMVLSELIKSDELELVGGQYGLAKLTEAAGLDHTIIAHAELVSEAYKRRRAIEVGGEMMTRSYETGEAIDDIVHETEQGLLQIIAEGDTSDTRTFRDLMVSFNEKLYKARENTRDITGVDTGFDALNEITSGWQPGDLIIIAARPSVGKTAFALNLAMNAILKDNCPVGFFSLEMDADSLMQRCVSALTMVNLERIRNGKVSDMELEHISNAMDWIIKMPVHIDDQFVVGINQLRARAKKLKRKRGIGALFIDYLQLMAGGKSGGNREQEIASISRGLKGIAKELYVPVIALSQLSRGVESRQDKEPQLSDLRESGAIEQDADVVIFLWHELDPNTGLPINFIKVAKHRNGKLDTIKVLRFFGNIQKWMNPEEAAAYMGETPYKPFAGIVPHADDRIESKKKISLTDGDEDAPF